MIQIDIEELGKIKLALTNIGIISKEAMIEQSSKAGNKGRNAIRRRMLQSTTEWTQQYIDGKRVLLKNKIAGNGFVMNKSNFKLGNRIAHRQGGGLDNPSNMANFITSFAMESTGTTVIGGVHKGFYPSQIKDGKIIGKLGRVSGVSRQTIAILEKLNNGSRGDYGQYLEWKNGKKSHFDESKWKKRHFFENGWNDVKGQIVTDMTTKLAEIIGKRANNMDLREKQYVV